MVGSLTGFVYLFFSFLDRREKRWYKNQLQHLASVEEIENINERLSVLEMKAENFQSFLNINAKR